MPGKRKIISLVRSAAAGDKGSFVELIDLHRQYLYATAMAVTHIEDEAMDAVQDTILTLWEKLDTLRDPGAFKTWTTRILLNNCYNTLRTLGRETPAEQLEEEAAAFDRDLSLDVRTALDRLGPEDKLILQLFYFEDLSVKDVARAMGITPEAARMRLSRSRKRFKQLYGTEVSG